MQMERGRARGRRGRGGVREKPGERTAVGGGGAWKAAGGRRRESARGQWGRQRETGDRTSGARGITDALKLPDEEDEWSEYAPREVISNWSHYDDAEKEMSAESGELQRGADFSVLLSSAGDSFTQFRLAEEKEWEIGYSSNKQISALCVDCEALVHALQDLPLHLRVNVEAELVQAEIPSEMPEMKSRTKEKQLSVTTHLQSSLTRVGRANEDLTHSETSTVDNIGKSQTQQRASSAAHEQTECLDSELDFLLSLEAPIQEKTCFQSKLVTYDTESLKKDPEEPAIPEVGATISKTRPSEQQKTASSKVSEEELENWLDSMIF